jgi:hypothetical protein
MVFTQAYVFAGVVNRTPLTNDDVTGNGLLAAEEFYTQSLADRVAAVLGTTYTFLVCHFLLRVFSL